MWGFLSRRIKRRSGQCTSAGRPPRLRAAKRRLRTSPPSWGTNTERRASGRRGELRCAHVPAAPVPPPRFPDDRAGLNATASEPSSMGTTAGTAFAPDSCRSALPLCAKSDTQGRHDRIPCKAGARRCQSGGLPLFVHWGTLRRLEQPGARCPTQAEAKASVRAIPAVPARGKRARTRSQSGPGGASSPQRRALARLTIGGGIGCRR